MPNAIVTNTYRYKRPPRKKRKKPALASVIVTPEPMKKRKGPVIRLAPESPVDPQPKRSAIVETRRSAGHAPELTHEEIRQRGDAADALFRELVRRVTSERD